MSLKVYSETVGVAKEHADRILRVSLNFNEFINKNIGDIEALKEAFGDKALNLVTNEEIKALFPDMTPDEIASAKKHLGVLSKLETVVKPIRDDLPKNDLG